MGSSVSSLINNQFSLGKMFMSAIYYLATFLPPNVCKCPRVIRLHKFFSNTSYSKSILFVCLFSIFSKEKKHNLNMLFVYQLFS